MTFNKSQFHNRVPILGKHFVSLPFSSKSFTFSICNNESTRTVSPPYDPTISNRDTVWKPLAFLIINFGCKDRIRINIELINLSRIIAEPFLLLGWDENKFPQKSV